MKKFASVAASILIGTVMSLPPAAAQKIPDRQVAITIDDLPAGSADFMDAASISAMTTKLLTTLRDQKFPRLASSTRRSNINSEKSTQESRRSGCGSTTGLSWETTPSVILLSIRSG